MRRRSTRNTHKSPEKVISDDPSGKKSRRQSRRRKKSTSQSSDDSNDGSSKVVTHPSEIGVVSKEVVKSHSPSDNESSEHPVWKVTTTNVTSGEVQKLKLCLTRPVPTTPERTDRSTRRRRNKSASHCDDDNSSPDKELPRRSKHRSSPGTTAEETSASQDTEEDTKNAEGTDDFDEKIGKGKSKGKHKSKIEKAPQVSEIDTETQSEISENAQVTAQSPHMNIDIPVDIVATNEVEQISSAENRTDTVPQIPDSTCDSLQAPVVETSEIKSGEVRGNEVNLESSAIESESVERDPVSEQRSAVGVEASVICADAAEICEQEDVSPPHYNQTGSTSNDNEGAAGKSEKKCSDNDSETENKKSVSYSNSEREENELSGENISQPEENECKGKSFDGNEETEKVDAKIKEVAHDNSNNSEKESFESKFKPESPPAEQSEEINENDQGEVNKRMSIESEDNDGNANQKNGSKYNSDSESSPKRFETSEERIKENSNDQVHSDEESPKASTVDESFTSVNLEDTLNLTRSFSPDIKQIVPENEQLQKIKPSISESLSPQTSRGKKSKKVRKRKWGKTLAGFHAFLPNMAKISIDTVKGICPHLEFLEEKDVKLESELRRNPSVDAKTKKSARKVSIDYSDLEHPKFETQLSASSSKSDRIVLEDTINIITFNRKISIVDDTASKLKPPPSPAKHPVTAILYITNLVRPFTLKQLKELLERTGKIDESGFWTDRIKSKCYVRYETEEEAQATRNALHGVQWPIGNGKKLVIDYGTPEDMERARNPPPLPPPPVEVQPVIREKEIEVPIKKDREEEDRGRRDAERRRNEVREWDVGKEDVYRKRSRERSSRHVGRRRNVHRTPSPEEDFISRKQRKVEESVPQKLMDDLFQKTKSTPSIYWLPLTPEEIATKQQQRLMRMAEHKRRMEETNRTRADYGRGGPFRRRYE